MDSYIDFRGRLEEALPLNLWDEAEKTAKRSTLIRHKTGAVIFDRNYLVVSKGCSHHNAWIDVPSTHAESHAISQGNGSAFNNNILIVTLTKPDNYAYSSRPCIKCAYHMDKVGIAEVIYAERLNDGTWVVNQETPEELIERATRSYTRFGSFAKDMRIGA